MSNSWVWAAILVVFVAAADQSGHAEDAVAEKVFEADKGPDKIDVSQYPKEQRKNYSVFSEKCSKCHTLARPINSDFALPEEWTAYVEKMRRKKRSGIDAASQKAITSFLIYDSALRKKDLIAEKEKLKKEGNTEIKGDGAGTPAAKDGAPAETKKDDAGEKESQKINSGD